MSAFGRQRKRRIIPNNAEDVTFTKKRKENEKPLSQETVHTTPNPSSAASGKVRSLEEPHDNEINGYIMYTITHIYIFLCHTTLG